MNPEVTVTSSQEPAARASYDYLSLRGAFAATKQSPVVRGDCSPAYACGASVAECARNDMWTKVNMLVLEWAFKDEL